jgi:hypothetical protein
MPLYLRVSNEPCTDKATVRRVELARKRRSVDLDVYGECRGNIISFGAEQKAKRLRACRQGECRDNIISFGAEQKAKRLRVCRQGGLHPDQNHSSSKKHVFTDGLWRNSKFRRNDEKMEFDFAENPL